MPKSVRVRISFELQSLSFPVLWTGGRSEDWLYWSFWHISRSWQQWYFSLTLAGSKQSNSHLAISQGSNMRAPSGGQMVTPACWGTMSLSWNGILWASGSPSAINLQPRVWQLIEATLEKQDTEMVKIPIPSGIDWEKQPKEGVFPKRWQWVLDTATCLLSRRWCHTWMACQGTGQSLWNQPSEFQSPAGVWMIASLSSLPIKIHPCSTRKRNSL